jgi:hypothetical protein
MNGSLERLARNQSLFREVNKRLRALSVQQVQVPWTDRTAYLCECGDDACLEMVELTPDQYEALRSDEDMFVLACGHEANGEDVMEQTDGFVVVRRLLTT